MKRPLPHKLINNNEYKQCSKCQEYKSLNSFTHANNTWDNLYPSCKVCKRLAKNYIPKKEADKLIDGIIYRLCSACNCWKQQMLFVPDERKCLECKKDSNAIYYIENKEILNRTSSQYYQEHKDKITSNHKIWVENNKVYLAEYGREYREIHKDELRIYDRNKHHKYKHNINYRITKNMRRRVLDAIKRNPKQSTTLKLVGCSIEELKLHLESLFLPSMSWDNYGQWHIDHIIPCSSFDLSNQNEQKKCFHYTNLQPLWAADNLKKGTKLS